MSTVLPLALYLLPAIIAQGRDHPKADSILILNTVLGWTVVGWLMALVDSTVIDLCATIDWAKFRCTEGRSSRIACLDHDGYLPRVVVITEGKRHDVPVARTLRFDPGTVVVMDRGYVDDARFGQLTAQEAAAQG